MFFNRKKKVSEKARKKERKSEANNAQGTGKLNSISSSTIVIRERTQISFACGDKRNARSFFSHSLQKKKPSEAQMIVISTFQVLCC